MGGSASLISTVFTAVAGMAGGSDKSDSLEKERAARQAEQEQQEAEERKRDRAKVLEAREVEDKRKRTSLLSGGSASLADDPEVAGAKLKNKLGE